MKKSRRLLLLVGLGLAAAVAGFWWFVETEPYWAAFGSIRIGMDRSEVERLVPTPTGSVEGVEVIFARDDGTNSVYQVGPWEVPGAPLQRPVVMKPKLVRGWITRPERDDKGVVHYKEVATGQVWQQAWHHGNESLLVIYDEKSRVVEKTYSRFRPRGPWWRRAKEWVSDHWPF